MYAWSLKNHYQVPVLLERVTDPNHLPTQPTYAQFWMTSFTLCTRELKTAIGAPYDLTQTYKGFVSDHSVEHMQCQNGIPLQDERKVSYITRDSSLAGILTPSYIWTTCLSFLYIICNLAKLITHWYLCGDKISWHWPLDFWWVHNVLRLWHNLLLHFLA